MHLHLVNTHRRDAIAAALDCMQPEGTGFNPSLMQVAGRLKFAAVGAEQALQLAFQRAEELSVSPRRFQEIVRAVNRAYAARTEGKYRPQDDSVKFAQVEKEVEKVEDICRIGATADKLRELSLEPVKHLTTWGVLRRLFPVRETLLCVGIDEATARVVRRDGDLDLDKCQFIVPSPMMDYLGKNQDGLLSPRTLNNTGPRRFLVVECDFSYYDKSRKNRTIWYDSIERLSAAGRTVKDMCASVITYLANGDYPLALVTFSGKKSLHAWFYVAGKTDVELTPFFRMAVALGADRVTWSRHQWVRMPGGLRYMGEEGDNLYPLRQEIYYFDPNYDCET